MIEGLDKNQPPAMSLVVVGIETLGGKEENQDPLERESRGTLDQAWKRNPWWEKVMVPSAKCKKGFQ